MTEERWTVTGPQTIDVDDVTSLRLGIVGGRFDVVTHDDSVTRIEISDITGTPLNIKNVAGSLEIRHQPEGPEGWLKNFFDSVTGNRDNTVVISIAVPHGIQVNASSVSGDGLVSGTTGNTRINTVSGSLVSDETRSYLDVNAVSGEAIVRNHEGSLKINTVSGPVTATGLLSDVKVNNVSGEIMVDLGGDNSNVNANTVSGDITVRILAEVGVDLTVTTAGGSVVVADHRFQPNKGRVQTALPGTEGMLNLKANTVSGVVNVIRPEAVQSTEPTINHEEF